MYVWVCGALTFSVTPLFTPAPLSPVLRMVPMSISMPMPSLLACSYKVVLLDLGWTLHTHSSSVFVPAWTHLQSHWAETFQACPIILRSGQGLQGPVR